MRNVWSLCYNEAQHWKAVLGILVLEYSHHISDLEVRFGIKFVPCGIYLRKFNYCKWNFQAPVCLYLENVETVVLYIGDRSAVVRQVSRTRHTPAKRCEDIYIYTNMRVSTTFCYRLGKFTSTLC